MTNDREFTGTPTGLAETYESLVDLIERGYDWTGYEYPVDDVTLRDAIELVLADPQPSELPRLAEVRARVDAADERLRTVLLTEPAGSDRWWAAHVSWLAGPELAATILSGHDVHVRLTSS